MTKLLVGCPFTVGRAGRPFEVSRDVLGTQHHLQVRGHDVLVAAPKNKDDFLYWKPFVPGEYQAIIDWGAENETVTVRVLFVTVGVEADVDAGAVAARSDRAVGDAIAAVDLAVEIAAHAVRRLLAWVQATTRMTGLLLSSDMPSLAGPVRVIEAETGERIRVGPSIRTTGEARDPSGKYHVTMRDMEALLGRVARDEEPPVAEALLADAEEHSRFDINDTRRAVLLAAIACEVKVKEVLRSRVSQERRRLLDYALDNPHEITLTAAGGLFNTLMNAALGRSLAAEDNALFRTIERLFSARNKVAHYGKLPEPADARRLVAAARRCFAWLDTL
jgi:hypothetical protein